MLFLELQLMQCQKEPRGILVMGSPEFPVFDFVKPPLLGIQISRNNVWVYGPGGQCVLRATDVGFLQMEPDVFLMEKMAMKSTRPPSTIYITGTVSDPMLEVAYPERLNIRIVKTTVWVENENRCIFRAYGIHNLQLFNHLIKEGTNSMEEMGDLQLLVDTCLKE